MSEFQLTDDIVTAVTAHMNDDHTDDNVVICRGVGGHPSVTAATMTGLDLEAIELTGDTPTGSVTIRIPFSAPIVDRAQIRTEIAQMFHDSVTLLDE